VKQIVMENLIKIDRPTLSRVARMIDQPADDASRTKTTVSAYPLINLDYYQADVYKLKAMVVDSSSKKIGSNKVDFEHRIDENNLHWVTTKILNMGEFLIKQTSLLKQLLRELEHQGYCSIQSIETIEFLDSIRFYVKKDHNPVTTTFVTNVMLVSVDKSVHVAMSKIEDAYEHLLYFSQYEKLLNEEG